MKESKLSLVLVQDTLTLEMDLSEETFQIYDITSLTCNTLKCIALTCLK